MRGAAFLLLFIPAVSFAAPGYLITSGTADLTANDGSAIESFSVAGLGFSFTGAGDVSVPPCALLEPCPPGTQIPSQFAALFSEDMGVSGTITIDDKSEAYQELPGYLGSAGIGYVFDISTPATNPPSSLTLTGPFTASAGLADPSLGSWIFSGGGTVTIRLNLVVYPPNTIPPTYELQSMHFAFTNAPEPGAGPMVFAAIFVLGILRLMRQFQLS